jgi:hypothetical protein
MQYGTEQEKPDKHFRIDESSKFFFFFNRKILLRLPIVQEVQTGAKQTKYKVKKQ